jgi:hypothetical protein
MKFGRQNEGIPVYKQFFVEDLDKVELAPWKRFGCQGAFVNLTDSHLTTAAILEIAPGGKTMPIKHLFETHIYGIKGRGKTTVRVPDFAPVSAEWGTFSLFSPPLNATY